MRDVSKKSVGSGNGLNCAFELLESRMLLSVSVTDLPTGVVAASTTATTTTTVHPSVSGVNPANGATGVSVDTFISAEVKLVGVGGGVDTLTVTKSGAVTLVQSSNGAKVAGHVNTTGGGDAIVFTPDQPLKTSTKYKFSVTSTVTDLNHNTFVPFSSTFTTSSKPSSNNSSIKFDKVSTIATGHAYTCVVIGPDHKLYASDDQGYIYRFNINSDGTLSSEKTISTVRNNNGGARLITGLLFGKSVNGQPAPLYVSNGAPGVKNAPDWSGKITVLTGSNYSSYHDLVVDLPRSYLDHLTNQMAWGPDGAIYFDQASMTAMGAPDATWGERSEHLLSGAILRLDLTKLGSSTLNVKTKDGGGKYDPFAKNAPLTIYADGVRNAYDLVWTHDGYLFAPVNGSSAGGNAPAGKAPYTGTRIDSATKGAYTGPAVPGLTNLPTQDDFLDYIQKGGYYGQPNPTRDEFVLNGGNPTSGKDAVEVPQYPVGMKPDRNYRGIAWDFSAHESPDGIIEYQGKAFNGQLNDKLLVVQYSGGDNIAILSHSGSKITSETQNVSGATDFDDPLDLTEDLTTGFIYVAEYGGKKITLLRPHSTSSSTSSTSKPATSLAVSSSSSTKQTANDAVDVSALIDAASGKG